MSLLSFHAQVRAAQMCVDESDIIAVIDFPEIVYPSPPNYGPDRLVFVAGRLAVVCGSDGGVITVLWRGHTGRGTSPAAA